jgi:hypothetical protein
MGDVVSNREFIIQLHAQDAEDELLAAMKEDTVVSGKRYTVRIESIEKPSYVQPGKGRGR